MKHIDSFKKFNDVNESVRHGAFPYFRIDKKTYDITEGIADNDLAEDAVNYPRDNKNYYQYCSSGWSVGQCHLIAVKAVELLKSGMSVEEIDDKLELMRY